MAFVFQIPEFSKEEPKIADCLYDIILPTLMNIFNHIDKIDPENGQKIIGSVLVFLPGIYEIERAYESLLKNADT